MGMTIRQQAFVRIYNGNAAESARRAGYSERTCRSIGRRLLTLVDVVDAIKQRQAEEERPYIADREARQTFWTSVMNDESAEMQHRLKAAELLGRSEGDFMEKLTVNHDVTIGLLFEPRARAELLAEIDDN